MNTNKINLTGQSRLNTLLAAQKGVSPSSAFFVCDPTPRCGFSLSPESSTAFGKLAKPKAESPLDISKALTQEELYRVAYLPFVIAEVVWDYVDTILDLACVMRLQPTKRLCRAMRELRRDYDRSRSRFIDDKSREVETEHMIAFQDEFRAYFNKLWLAVKSNLRQRHGQLEENSEMLVCSVHMAMVCFKALRKFTYWADDLIESKCGRANHSIMPDQIRRLGILLPEFAGNCQIDLDTPEMEMWRDTLYNHIHSIEFTGIPDKDTK